MTAPLPRSCPACGGLGHCLDAVCCGEREGDCCGQPVVQDGACAPCSGRGWMSPAAFLNHALLLGDERLLAQHEAMTILESLGPKAFQNLKRPPPGRL